MPIYAMYNAMCSERVFKHEAKKIRQSNQNKTQVHVNMNMIHAKEKNAQQKKKKKKGVYI